MLVNMKPDHEVEPHLPDHLDDVRNANRSARTIRERRLTVLRVARHLGHPVAEVTRDELRAWQNSQSHLKPASMHNAVVHVTVYLNWLVTRELRVDNPSVTLIRPKHPRQGIPHPMSGADIITALQSAAQPVHAWIGLGAFCGLRCMEMAKLAREDIVTGARPYLRIVGKGGKERIVDIPGRMLTELLGPDFPDEGYLFTRMDGHGGPPSATRVSERINDHLHSLGIAGTAHALRHRYGTELYAETRDPFRVADAMGHGSTDTTRGYVALAADQVMVNAVERISNLVA